MYKYVTSERWVYACIWDDRISLLVSRFSLWLNLHKGWNDIDICLRYGTIRYLQYDCAIRYNDDISVRYFAIFAISAMILQCAIFLRYFYNILRYFCNILRNFAIFLRYFSIFLQYFAKFCDIMQLRFAIYCNWLQYMIR